MKFILLTILILAIGSMVALAEFVVEIRNSEGEVEAALAVGPNADAIKDFDAFIEYDETTHLQYPLAQERHPTDRTERVGLGTFVRISHFSEDGGKYKFFLLLNESTFDRFETSETPSRIIRIPIVRKYEFKGPIALQQDRMEFGGMPGRKAWSVQVRRIDEWKTWSPQSKADR
jgi:hypothetical protein